jgi:hypothetical protein
LDTKSPKYLEMAQGHISLSISPFWWFMPTQHKASRTSAKSLQIRTQNCFDSYLTYMDHSLPPLGLFLKIKLNFLSLSQTHLLKHKERYFMRTWSRIKKLPLFPIIKPFPTREQLLTIRGNQEYLDKQKPLFLLFSKFSQVVADPFIALALFSPPLASSTKTGSILAL